MPAKMTPLAALLGENPEVAAVRQKLEQLLRREADARRLPPILLQGETGTGKGLLARAIHRAGPRRDGPFVDVSCAAIPETLLEAEMFGFERGAFTDARQAKAGLLQAAHRGTIFLDEVGLLPKALQPKLLKALEEQAVRRLGSVRSEPVDVWVVAATSEDLVAAARERRFREDLYHRLAVLTVWLPPLRERGEDILLLAEHFLARACADYHLPPKIFDPSARTALLAYRWPGNIRELTNVIERVALLSEGTVVTSEMLGFPEATPTKPTDAAREEKVVLLEDALGSAEREHLLNALTRTNWNLSRAAALLGVSRNTLRYRIEKHCLRPGVSLPAPRRGERADATEPTVPAAIPALGLAPTSIRWEQRRLTLLRADLLPPKQERPSVDSTRQLEFFIEKVQSFGGRVEELGMTGMVAAFGLEPVEDAPRRAVLAALAIQKAVEHARQESEPFGTKIGIHVGQFLVGYADGVAKIDLDAKRHAWMVLEALVVKAEPNAIVVSQGATPFLERRFDLVPLGMIEPLVGKFYRVFGRERAWLGPGGRVTRFVGRDHELGLLWSRFRSAARGQGQIVGIAGEAGIGKSRLLYEFGQGLKEERITYLEGYCLSYGTTIPYLPVLDVLREACEITEADSHETVAEKVHATLEAAGLDPKEKAQHLFHLLGISEDTDQLAALGPEAIRARTFETLTQLSLRTSRQKPLVIVLEDLHWIDKTSEEYFTALAEAIAGARILLVSTYRFGYRPPWIEKSYAAQISLQALAPEDSVNIVRSVLGTDQVADSVLNVLLSKAEGNPFFLEELAWTVREQGGLPPALVPDTIEEVIQARIDRLPPEEKTLLQSASVIGKDVPFVLLKAVANLPDEALNRGLTHLQAAEFLHELSPGPDTEYTFKHTLTQEVAYGSLVRDRRREVDARIVDAIERLYPDQSAEQLDRLAHHSFRGEVWEKALTYCREAAARAFARSAHVEALNHVDHALEALEQLGAASERKTLELDLVTQRGAALRALRGYAAPEVEKVYLKARELCREVGDTPDRFKVEWQQMQFFLVRADLHAASELATSLLAYAERRQDRALLIDAHLANGMTLFHQGDFAAARDHLEHGVALYRSECRPHLFTHGQDPGVFCLSYLAWTLWFLGYPDQAKTDADTAVGIAEQKAHPFTHVSALTFATRVYQCRRDLERVRKVAREVVSLSRDRGFAYYEAQGLIHEGWALVLMEEDEAGHSRMFDGYRALERTGTVLGLRGALVQLAEACKRIALVDKALWALDRAENPEQGRGTLCWQAEIARLRAELAGEGPGRDPETARRWYLRALQTARRQRAKSLELRVALSYAKTLRSEGRWGEARKLLDEVTSAFTEGGETVELREARALLNA